MICLLKQDRSRLHGAECRQTRNRKLQRKAWLLRLAVTAGCFWLAVSGCYFAGLPVKKPTLPRLRQTRWLLFCCIISEIGQPPDPLPQPDAPARELCRRDPL